MAGAPVGTTDDHAEVARLLDAAVAFDPVGNTIFNSMRAALDGPDGVGWAAYVANDPGKVAARTRLTTMVTISPAWDRPRELGELIAELEPPPVGLACEPTILADVLAGIGREPTRRMDERLFRLDELTRPAQVSGSARPAAPDDYDRLTDWYTAFILEAFGRPRPAGEVRTEIERSLQRGTCWLWSDPTPVSFAVRHAAVAGAARIGPVYTPVEVRGRGYGSAVTAAATEHVLADGAVPCLFTDLANPTSNRIYQALGYRPVLDRCSVRFD